MSMRACGAASGCDLKFFEIDGKFSGVFLPADFTAEHEWGILGINDAFGIRMNPNEDVGIYGLDARKVTTVPELHYAEDGGCSVFLFNDRAIIDSELELFKYAKDVDLSRPNKQGLAASWCGDAFCIAVTGNENQIKLKKLHEALVAKNVVIFLGGSDEDNPFSRRGLSILLYDTFPTDITEDMIEKDKLYFSKMAEKHVQARESLKRVAETLGLAVQSNEGK